MDTDTYCDYYEQLHKLSKDLYTLLEDYISDAQAKKQIFRQVIKQYKIEFKEEYADTIEPLVLQIYPTKKTE